MNQKYKRLDFSKLKHSDEKLSSEDTLKEIEPIQWSEDVLSGKKKVVIRN